MIQALQKQSSELLQEQRFIWQGITWQQFKGIQSSFADVAGVRLSYCKGTLEIMSTSKLHEAIKCLIAALLVTYFEVKGIEFFPSGSFTQAIEGVVEYQADLSYCIEVDKDKPDLSIEVIITSGGTNKLDKYKQMGVSEVWFWEDGVMEFYHLRERDYERIYRSELLPELDSSLLARCTLFSSYLEAIREFRGAIAS